MMRTLRTTLFSSLGAILLAAPVQAGDCDATAGSVATLSTKAHNVSGTVTILDDHTLLVENFFYDGGGISVFFYLGVDATSASFQNGVALGEQLLGKVFNGDTLVLDVPDGVALENYGAISVWCVAAAASFGDGTFTPPPSPTVTLAATPGNVVAADTLSFSSCGGEPGGALGLVVTGVNGSSFFNPISFGTFTPEGGWSLPVVVPAGLTGLNIEFQTYGYVSPFKIGASNPMSVQFL